MVKSVSEISLGSLVSDYFQSTHNFKRKHDKVRKFHAYWAGNILVGATEN